MKGIGGVVLTVMGVCLALLGLLFLVGSAGQARRLVIAVVSLGGGAALVGVGIRLFRGALAVSSHRIQAELLALAKREDGEVSEAEVRAALGERWVHVRPVLDRMISQGFCRESRVDGSTFYVFPDLQARLTVRRCQYCDAELPISEELASCPQCGGTFETRVVRVSISDGSYGMDEG